MGGLHLDLRALATVRLVETRESSTGWAAQLGPGATWAQVWGHTVHLYTKPVEFLAMALDMAFALFMAMATDHI